MVSRKRKRVAGYTTPRAKGSKKTSNLFVKKHPGIGEVPMLFFIPKWIGRNELVDEIQNNGGMVIDGYESFVYQIKIPSLKSKKPSTFHRGFVYKSQWVQECIKQGEIVEDDDKFLVGFHKKSTLCTIKKNKRKQYTITEVLKIWECYEQEGYKIKKTAVPPLSFFQKIEAQNIIPDRTATSLRTAWKKFSKLTKSAFVRAALKKSGTRYSHYFADAPDVPVIKKKNRSGKKNLNSLLNTASTKPREEEDSRDSLTESPCRTTTPKRKRKSLRKRKEESEACSDSDSQEEIKDNEMEVEMEVNTKEPSVIDVNGDEMEFLLAIEDMQSAISHGPEDVEASYEISGKKKEKTASFGELCEQYTGESFKRIKVTEAESIGTTFNESSTTVYDQDDLHDYVEHEAKIRIHSNLDHSYKVESSLPKKSVEEGYFREITDQLEEYWKIYHKTMEEMHTYWMEACWDMEDLTKILVGEKQKWTSLEDIAVQSDPGTEEFVTVSKDKGQDEIAKRRKFFELE